MGRTLKLALLVWGLFDVGTGLLSIASPATVAALLWPTAHADALVLLRRAGVFWLMMGIVQLGAFRKFPSPTWLYLAAFVRSTDGLADLAWLTSGTAFSVQGWATIGPSPALCFIVAWMAWKTARSIEPGRS